MQNYCYAGMFKNCTLLEEAPRVDAVTLATRCFFEMFSGCSVLRTAQDAFAFSGNVPEYACYQMFLNCIALTGAPEMLSVSTVGNYGCKEMYKGCIELRTAPSSLNATTVGTDGYRSMFLNCARLEAAPAIAATSIGNYGCMEMFRGCTRMQTPPASLSATTLGKVAYKWMFYQCSALESAPDFPHDPAGTYVLPPDADGTKTGLCYQMFFQCNALTSLEGKKLFSSTTLMTPFCFEDMFSECKYLETVPTDFLPATSVAASCYRGMFQSTKITRTPDLPASTLASECYRYMFNGCSQLTYIKCLATTNIGEGYTTNWVGNNKTGGNVPNTNSCKFERAGTTDWPSGVNGKLSNWVYYTPTP